MERGGEQRVHGAVVPPNIVNGTDENRRFAQPQFSCLLFRQGKFLSLAEEQKAGIGIPGPQLIENIEGSQGIFCRNACPHKTNDGSIARDPKPMPNGGPVRGRESEFFTIDPVVHQGIVGALKKISTCDLAACPAITRRPGGTSLSWPR